MSLAVALHLVAPVALLWWLLFRTPPGRFHWGLGALLVLGGIAAVSLAVPWLAVPGFLRDLYLAVWCVGAARSGMRIRQVAAGTARSRWRALRTGALVTVTAAAWTTAGLAVDGRRVPDADLLDLACPLGPGTYLVASGGSRLVVNAHLLTLADEPRYAPWRGQSHGVDFVQVDGFGRRARRMASPNLIDYRIYGQHVVAPCAGAVAAAVDGRPDMPVGVRDPDRSRLAGNHVVLRCGVFEVLLAHLQPGSVRVATGDVVAAGDLLGFVGNSGHTDEPHLHVSAQRRVDGLAWLGGEPVWITLAGRFLVRNDRLVCE